MKTFRTLLVTICAAVAALALAQGKASAGGSFTSVPFGVNSANSSSWAGGGHGGYNWQQGQAVFGFETDLQATNLHSVMNDHLMFAPPSGIPPSSFAQSSASIDWYGTLRGRIGWSMGQWLFYGTGGLAYGEVGLSSIFRADVTQTQLQTTSRRAGYVVGVGMDYLLRPNFSLGLSYQFVDLGRISATSNLANGADLFVNQAVSAHAQFQTVMASLSWHFAPMPSAGPWAGGYAGANVGGAWGNDASATYNSQFAP